jgi:hypothetical protein
LLSRAVAEFRNSAARFHYRSDFLVLLTTRFSEVGQPTSRPKPLWGFTREIIQKTAKAVQNILRCILRCLAPR